MIARIKGVSPMRLPKEFKNYYLTTVIGQKPSFIEDVEYIETDFVETTNSDYSFENCLIPVLEINLDKVSPSALEKLEKMKHLFVNLLNENNNIKHIPLSKSWTDTLKPKHLGELAHFVLATDINSPEFGKAKFKALFEYKN